MPLHIERSFFLSFRKNNSIDVKNMPKWRHLRWKMSTIFPAAGGERKKEKIQLFFYLLSNIDTIFIFFLYSFLFFLVCFINFINMTFNTRISLPTQEKKKKGMKERWKKIEEGYNSVDDSCFFFKVNATEMNVCPYEHPQKKWTYIQKRKKVKRII